MNNTQLICLYIVGIGANGTPNGHLFAHSMSDGVDLELHNKLISVLKHVGWVQESNWFLTLTEKGLAKHAELVKVLLEKPEPTPEWKGVYPGMCINPEECKGRTCCPRALSCCE